MPPAPLRGGHSCDGKPAGTEAQKEAARLEFAVQEGIYLSQSSGSASRVEEARLVLVKAEEDGESRI